MRLPGDNKDRKAGCAIDLWQVEIALAEGETGSPEERWRLQLTFAPNAEAIRRREALGGASVPRTSLDSKFSPAEQVDAHYRRLHHAERAFRHIKSYLQIRPIYRYRRRRVRAHVLLCFLKLLLGQDDGTTVAGSR